MNNVPNAAVQATLAAKAAREDRNKQVVLEFYRRVLIPMDFTAAPQFFGPSYTQHNPAATDGPPGLKAFLARVRVESPHAQTFIKRVFADGDHVIVHSHVIPDPDAPGLAVIDIMRLENGKLVEHWDVIQPIPLEPLNSNTMF